jgi:hypothetical protein
MSYTVWSQGRLLGETELSYTRWMHKHRGGDFFPTEFGETLMPIVTGGPAAMKELAKAMHVAARDSDDAAAAKERRAATPEITAARAELESAVERRDALALELRRPDGSIVPTEYIDIRDTELLWDIEDDEDDLGFDDDEIDDESEGDSEIELAVLHDLEIIDEIRAARGFVPDEPWGHEFPRYQILLRLLDNAAIP